MSFTQLIAILKARKLVALIIFSITLLSALLVSLLLPKTYTSTATLIINTKGTDPITGQSMQAMMLPGYLATQIDILESKKVGLKVVDRLQVEKNASAIERFQQETQGQGDIKLWFVEQLAKKLDVEPSKKSNTIYVSYQDSNPAFAADMANAYAAAYLETSLQLKVSPAKQAAAFFESQINTLRKNVEQAQSKLSAFQKEKGITGTEGRLDVEMARLSDLSSQLVVAQAQASDSSSRNAQLRRQGAAESPDIIGNALIQGLKSQLVQAKAKLTDLSQRLGVNHPSYQAALQDVENIREAIQREIAKTGNSVGQIARASAQKQAQIKASLAAQKERVLKLKSERDEMAALERELQSAQQIYDSALIKFGQTNLESQSGQTDVAILNQATPPLKPSSPKMFLNMAIATFLGAVLGLIAAMVAELGSRRVRVAEDIESVLGVDVLADFSKMQMRQKKDGWLKRLFNRQSQSVSKNQFLMSK